MRFRDFLTTVTACAVAVCACVGLRAVSVDAFPQIEGARTFYLDSASSQSLQTSTLSLADLSRVKGESVQFSIPVGDDPAAIAEEIAEEYRAQICFVEEAGGTVSYYCYTPALAARVYVKGAVVNLHIAIAKDRAAVGYPLIFGGF